MADQSDKSNRENTAEKADDTKKASCEAFVAQLTQQERMLVLLQKELYEGSWEAMLADLRNRLQGKPYIFKLVNRIQDDIVRIGNLRDFEQKYGVTLADYIEPDKETGQ